MKPIKFPHQQFLDNNRETIATHPLPEMLQKRILGFEELEEDLPHTMDGDHARLLSKMESLSHELDEDLEDYFAPWLENNDEEEEPVEVLQEVNAIRHDPEIIKEADDQEELPQITKDLPEIKPLVETPQNNKLPLVVHSDEEILTRLLEDQMDSIHPSELRRKGFKGLLEHRTVFVGRFCLRRGKYDTCYKISLQPQ